LWSFISKCTARSLARNAEEISLDFFFSLSKTFCYDSSPIFKQRHFPVSEHRHSFYTVLCGSNCNPLQCYILSSTSTFTTCWSQSFLVHMN
jgi:hypothetical protein